MEPDYFDICMEDRMMGLTGFYDPSDESYGQFVDDDYYDELDDCEE